MRIFPTLLMVALCACGTLSRQVRADDPPTPPVKPAEPPKPGEPKPGEPKPGDPPPSEPTPGEPPAPAPTEPTPQTPEEKAAAEEKARKEEEARKKQEEEEAKQAEADELERQRREEARKKASGEEDRPPPPVAPRPGPPGMSYLPASDSPLAAPPEPTGKSDAPPDSGGAAKEDPPAPADKGGKEGAPPPKGAARDESPGGGPPAKPAPPGGDKPKGIDGAPAPAPITGALIGTRPEELNRLIGKRGPEVLRNFLFESPQHRRKVREAFIDTTEITNAQWYRFLQDYTKAYVCDGKYPTLVDVGGYMLNSSDPKEDDVTWRQIAEQNKDALQKALPDVLAAPGALWPQAFKHAILPKRDLLLTFYSRRVPDDWPGVAPLPERLNHPVRFISGLDLDAFAEWAGKHVQTEFEYEYAARGRDGMEYPWGKIWHPDAEWCNWGAKVKDLKTQEADTWTVGSHPKGRSWIGAMDLIGNVAEWTSSKFALYPGNKQTNDFLGVVRIIRGGTAVDQETLILRPAARNFIGTGVNSGPPFPQNHYAWVGGRCAWWPQAGANQAPFIEARVTRGHRVIAWDVDSAGREIRGDLDLDRLAGTVAEDPDPDGRDGVWVKGRCKSAVMIPLRSLVHVSEEKAKEKEKEKDEDALSYVVLKAGKESLLKASETDEPRIIFGAFHTDARLLKVGVRKRLPTPANEEERKEREKEEKKQRGRVSFPVLQEGTCAPDSYLLALWHKKLCLVDSSREFVCCLTAADKLPSLEYKKAVAGQLPTCKVTVDDAVNLINVTVALPVGSGKGTDPLLWVVASFSVEVHQEDVVSPNGWR